MTTIYFLIKSSMCFPSPIKFVLAYQYMFLCSCLLTKDRENVECVDIHKHKQLAFLHDLLPNHKQ